VVSHWGHAVGYDWDLPSTSYSYQIHFIHIKGVWHALYVVGGHKGATPYHTITLQGQFGEERVLVLVFGMYYTLLCNDWDLSHFILIPDPLHTYKRWLTYSVCVGQSYECVLTPPITMIWPSLELESLVLMFGRMVMAIVNSLPQHLL